MEIQGSDDNHDCVRLPFWVVDIPHYPMVLLQIQMLLVFCVTQLLHRLLLKPLGMPPFVSQIFAGLAIGPAGMGRWEVLRQIFFPVSSIPVIRCIAMLGHAFSLFLIATTMDFTIIRRTGKKTIMIGMVTLICSLVANVITQLLLKPEEKYKTDVGMAVTALPVIGHPVLVRLLTDIGLVNSEIGRLSLASGLCVEIVSIFLTMVTNNITPALNDKSKILQSVMKIFAVFGLLIVAVYVVRPFMKFLIKLTPKGRPVRDTYLFLAFLIMLIGALITNALGQWVLFGAFMFGSAYPDGPPLGSALVDKFGSLVLGVLFPFYVSTTAMRVNIHDINIHGTLFQYLGILIVVSTATKILACFICGLCSNMHRNDALSLAVIMCARGFLEIGTFSFLTDMKIISPECFSVMTLHVAVVSFAVPAALKFLYNPMKKYGGYQTRDIIHLKQSQGLRLVACVIRNDNIASVTNLLRIINPGEDAPITVNVLHLMKLAGRCQPLFISHDMQKKQTSNLYSYSEEVVWHFERLQCTSKGVVQAHVFTALAHHNAMHEYICTLALDKVASLIILPFHRKYGIEGVIDRDDTEQRTLNSSVLERSPSSVAILVDRSCMNLRQARGSFGASINVVTTSTETLASVAVIFIGGSDDREAIAFARRMSRGKMIRLTVIRLALLGDPELITLDAAAIDMLSDTSSGKQNIMYIEMTVRDGVQTTLKLRSIIQDYDLIIVGRRMDMNSAQTVGLSESSEIKELGILGDFLASPDHKCKTSVLVIQQQQH